jgi:sec-independent protein translocase protein TatA
VIGDILQPTHLLFVLVIALLVLGPKRLPEVGKSLGRGLRDFRSALNGEERDRDSVLPTTTSEVPPAPVATAPIEHVAPVEQAVAAHHVAPVEHLESEPVSTGEAVETPQHVS